MPNQEQDDELTVHGWQALRRYVRYRPATRVGRVAYRIAVVSVLMFVLAQAFPGFHSLGMWLFWLLNIVLLPLLLVLLVRTINRRLLWKVRNRLILTYVLMGLAPVVLFGTITGVAAYIFAGQFATNTARSSLDEVEHHLGGETNIIAVYINSHGEIPKTGVKFGSDDGTDNARASLAVLEGGTWHALPLKENIQPETSPFIGQPQLPWLQKNFDGMVAIDGRLYLCSVAVITSSKGTTALLGSIPLDGTTLNSVAHGTGRVMIVPGFRVKTSDANATEVEANVPLPEDVNQPANSKAVVPTVPAPTPDLGTRPVTFGLVNGGSVPPAKHLLDLRVFFSAPVAVTSWQTGETLPALIGVVSRPTALYDRLFASAVKTGSFVRIVLITIATTFGLLEIFSLFMAIQMSRTITNSIAELYQGTTEIDHGNLAHRVEIKRHDQLGALATSFNAMAGSIEDLLVQQREKERLLNELMIAQEVQRNLFPTSPVRVAGLEVHALCVPARTVSGDYFDYIFGEENWLCIALGDISGKGISAALLMASLHSAVRSFTLGSGEGPSRDSSPAHLLGCLNRHLYRSTQMEKYATLFLAFYNSASGELTYSNGGHLPPLIFSNDGTVQRLDQGGPVVGLLDNLQYEQSTVRLRPGDLLVAYTDGITEPENAEGEFGEDRLRSFMQTNELKALDILALDAIGVVKEWVGAAEQPDDMTILLARQT